MTPTQQPSVTQADVDFVKKIHATLSSVRANYLVTDIANYREASTAELRAENERGSEIIATLHRRLREEGEAHAAVIAEAVQHKKARVAQIKQLQESLRWAIAEIEGVTRYERDDQFDNCLTIARATLSAQPSERRLTKWSFQGMAHDFAILDEWPEYEPVWDMLESRVTGKGPQPDYEMDLQRRRVVTLAKLGLILSARAEKGQKLGGFMASDLYADVLIALAIEDSEDPKVVLEVALEYPEGDTLMCRTEDWPKLRAENERLRDALGLIANGDDEDYQHSRLKMMQVASAALSAKPSGQDAADDTGISCEACAGSIADGEDHVSYKDGIALCSKCAAADVD